MKTVNFIMILVCAVVLMGCVEEEVTCTDVAATEFVLELADKEMYKGLLPVYVAEFTAELDRDLEGVPIYDEYIEAVSKEKILYWSATNTMPTDGNMMGRIIAEVVGEHFEELKEHSATALLIHEEVSKEVEDLNMTLDGIRVYANEPELKKITCEAEIKFSNGNEHTIWYSIQSTEDDQIYVQAKFDY